MARMLCQEERNMEIPSAYTIATWRKRNNVQDSDVIKAPEGLEERDLWKRDTRHLQPRDSLHPLRNIVSSMVSHHRIMLEYLECECTENHNTNRIARRLSMDNMMGREPRHEIKGALGLQKQHRVGFFF